MSKNVSEISKSATIQSFPQEPQPLAFELMSPELNMKKLSLSLDIIMSIMNKVDQLEQDFKFEKALKMLENLIAILESIFTFDEATKRIKSRVFERMGKLSNRLKLPAKALKYFQKDLEINSSLKVCAIF